MSKTPIFIQTDANGNIVKVARGKDINLADSGIDKSWRNISNDKLVHLAQGIGSKRFRLNQGKLEVKDTHEIVNGKLRMKKVKRKP